jgi:hypothetical protein
MNRAELAAYIVDAVLADLRGRQGIGDAIERVRDEYEDIYNGELLPELRELVSSILDAEASIRNR